MQAAVWTDRETWSPGWVRIFVLWLQYLILYWLFCKLITHICKLWISWSSIYTQQVVLSWLDALLNWLIESAVNKILWNQIVMSYLLGYIFQKTHLKSICLQYHMYLLLNSHFFFLLKNKTGLTIFFLW